MLYLLHLKGEQIVRCDEITQERIDLGRGIENTIIFDTQEVSRYHARLILPSSIFTGDQTANVDLTDLGSAYGVWVDGEQVFYHSLQIGEVFYISEHFKLCLSYDPHVISVHYKELPPKKEEAALLACNFDSFRFASFISFRSVRFVSV